MTDVTWQQFVNTIDDLTHYDKDMGDSHPLHPTKCLVSVVLLQAGGSGHEGLAKCKCGMPRYEFLSKLPIGQHGLSHTDFPDEPLVTLTIEECNDCPNEKLLFYSDATSCCPRIYAHGHNYPREGWYTTKRFDAEAFLLTEFYRHLDIGVVLYKMLITAPKVIQWYAYNEDEMPIDVEIAFDCEHGKNLSDLLLAVGYDYHPINGAPPFEIISTRITKNSDVARKEYKRYVYSKQKRDRLQVTVVD